MAIATRREKLPPPSAGPVVDIGCGSGQLVRCLLDDGYDAAGIDVSPEQALRHANNELEARVQERTLDLTRSNDDLRLSNTAVHESEQRYRQLANLRIHRLDISRDSLEARIGGG